MKPMNRFVHGKVGDFTGVASDGLFTELGLNRAGMVAVDGALPHGGTLRRIDLDFGAAGSVDYEVTAVTPHGDIVLFAASGVTTKTVHLSDFEIPIMGDDLIKITTTGVGVADQAFAAIYVQPFYS